MLEKRFNGKAFALVNGPNSFKITVYFSGLPQVFVALYLEMAQAP